MVARDIEKRLKQLAGHFPAVVLTGPRQSGKSTLCRSLFGQLPYATLESPDVRSFALDDPRGFLGRYPAGAILDEIQNVPDLPSYLQEMVDRDPSPGRWILITNVGDLVTFQRFVQLCAGRVGQLLNLASLAADCGITAPTAKAWFSVLEASFIAFRLPGYHGNFSKRLIKMPKIHFYDSGLVCWLLGIREASQLNVHPLRGSIFESWVVSEIVKNRMANAESEGVHFFRDKAGLEADVLVQRRTGFVVAEVKAGQTIGPGMAAEAGKVQGVLSAAGIGGEIVVVHGGDARQVRNGVTYLPWNEIQNFTWK
jgi:predicted AAA+ superfamily ATPase